MPKHKSGLCGKKVGAGEDKEEMVCLLLAANTLPTSPQWCPANNRSSLPSLSPSSIFLNPSRGLSFHQPPPKLTIRGYLELIEMTYIGLPPIYCPPHPRPSLFLKQHHGSQPLNFPLFPRQLILHFVSQELHF